MGFFNKNRLNRLKGLITSQKFTKATKLIEEHISYGNHIRCKDQTLSEYIRHYRNHLINIRDLLNPHIQSNNLDRNTINFDFKTFSEEMRLVEENLTNMARYVGSLEEIIEHLE